MHEREETTNRRPGGDNFGFLNFVKSKLFLISARNHPFLEDNVPQVFLRSRYEKLHEILKPIKICAITGNPGIEKAFFGYYLVAM